MKQKNGYKVIKNCISRKSSKYLFDTLLNLLKFYSPDLFTNKKFNNWNNKDFNNRLIHLRNKNKNIFSAIYDSLSKSNALVQFCYMNRLDKIASNFLSVPKNCLSVRTFTLRMDVPNDKRNLYGWHQDSSYDKYNISGTNGVVLWIPLVSTNAKNGSLIIKLGSEANDINASVEKKRGGKFKRDNSVDKLINLEHKLGLDNAETFYKFDEKIKLVREKLNNLVCKLKNQGKTIAGFGAPTKATTLMAHFGLDENVLDFIVDDNPLKQGLFTPITHIPVLSSEALYDRRPDYVLILAWNFSEEIIKAHQRYRNEIGKFILPMPVPQIVE